MDNNITGNATMGPEQLKNYQQMLLNNVIAQKLEQNEKQTKTITDYKNRHKKVIEGLEVYPLSLSENCMVPIGKRAFMKGKLIHTNEILASLGGGYFAKYSASQAIALCNRRIAWADEMLKNLEIERNLFEMKQYLPLQHDVFGEDDRKDIVEHWSENKLDEWRVQHRQREKEYRQKLAELREQEKIDIRTEEDLFERLNELELEEELEDEIFRLETERKKFYGDDLKEGEVYDESEEDASDIDEVGYIEKIQEELKKLKDIQMGKITSDISSINPDIAQDKTVDINISENKQSHSSANFSQEKLRRDYSSEPQNVSNTKGERRISFAEPCIIENDGIIKKEISIFQESCSALKQEAYNENSADGDDIIKIEFSHSSHIPHIFESDSTEIRSPVDIYKMFSALKSILKRSPNDMIPNQVAPPVNEYSSSDTEDEDEYVKRSAYNSVIKETVHENKTPIDVSKKSNEKKIMSKFKLERTGKKK
ncbi:hypothetical protein P5V15_010954 [Pogonomyrmex californicus]